MYRFALGDLVTEFYRQMPAAPHTSASARERAARALPVSECVAGLFVTESDERSALGPVQKATLPWRSHQGGVINVTFRHPTG